MFGKILLLVTLPLIALPVTSLAASSNVATPTVAASLSSQPLARSVSARNKPVLISQYYPEDDRRAQYWWRVREHRRRCEATREYLQYHRNSFTPRQLHYQWERLHYFSTYALYS